MSNTKGFFDDGFEQHTKAKLQVLKSYLEAWAQKLLRGGVSDRVYFIDGFAGPGQDGDGVAGSPRVAAEIARRIGQEHGGKLGVKSPMRVRAIEKDADHFTNLARVAEEFSRHDPELLQANRGTFPEHVDRLFKEIGTAPTITFLDPFGIKGLDASTYPKALAGKNNEVFALFNHASAKRHHGVVVASEQDIEQQVSDLPQTLFPELDASQAAQLRAQREEKAVSLDTTSAATRANIERALGGAEWVEKLSAVPMAERPEVLLELFCQVLKQSGAEHVVIFPLRNEDGQPVYALVHGSKSVAAYITMKAEMCAGLKKPEIFSPKVRALIEHDLRVPLQQIVAGLEGRYQGKQVRWAPDKKWDSNAVRCAILEDPNIHIFNFQMEDLKTLLTQKGYLKRIDNKLWCVFPERPTV